MVMILARRYQESQGGFRMDGGVYTIGGVLRELLYHVRRLPNVGNRIVYVREPFVEEQQGTRFYCIHRPVLL
jgi:hypothetical protein